MINKDQSLSVELISVTKRYGNVVAVDSINLTIASGEFFSFLGPSGCGKTTTLRMIAGLERPDVGKVRINGELVNDLPPYERNVSTVFQRLALFPHMTVAENIAFGLKIQRQSRNAIEAKTKKILDLVHLSGYESRYPEQLSGGQQQRVALARSLILEPEVLLLDEPLAALDRKLRKEMQIELRRIQQEVGITFIYVTHDQKEALSMSDRISVMHQGKIIQSGSPQEIYEHPKTPFVADFLGASNFLSGLLVKSGNGFGLQMADGLLIHIESRGLGASDLNTNKMITLRPEAIEISLQKMPLGAKNCFAGVVVNKVYLGDSTEFEVLLNQNERLKVYVDGHRKEAQLSIAADVFVHWDDAVCNLIRSD
ncbi:ABC transporter ATP-binding protein [Candidatus Acetothermia bacterium]|nr:ABC transporter ATP-binding protein [Candidatus Acetothermia bacterium]MBI3643202.1 ABC transporter ATP-binding protein [Candidatus Acetothermia bacterium]